MTADVIALLCPIRAPVIHLLILFVYLTSFVTLFLPCTFFLTYLFTHLLAVLSTLSRVDPFHFPEAVKCKGRIFIQCYLRDDRTSVLYNLEVAVEWQELANTTAPISHTSPLPRKHSPDSATRARKQTSDYSLLLSSTSKG